MGQAKIKDGWLQKNLIDVCKEITDGSHFSPKSSPEYKYPYITVRDIKDGIIDFTNCKFVNDKDYDLLLKNGCKPNKGDLLFSKDGTVGKVALVNIEKEFVVLSSLAILRPKNDLINSELLEYILRHPDFLKTAIGKKTGVAIRRIILKNLKNIEIKFPKSLTEQKQIVALLDQAFKAIDQAQQNIEKNIANAKELFQSKLNAIFSQTGEGWEEKTLGEACIVERGSSPRPIKSFITDSDDGVNWIKIGDVGENDKYVQTTKQKITKEGAAKSRFVDIGDFILSNSMSFGRAYIMAIQGYIHDGWFVLRIPKEINSDYFWQLLSSPYLKNQFNQLAAGAIVKNISGDLVKKAIVPIPPLEKQIQIFKETDILTKEIEEVVNRYEKKLNNLEELKKSILQKAFNGELT